MTKSVMSYLRTILRQIEADAEERGWDQRPVLFSLHLRPLAGAVAEMVAVNVPLFDLAHGDAGNSGDALHMLAATIKDLDPADVRGMCGDGLFGLVIVDEAWMVRRAPDTALPAPGTIQHMPDRIEGRWAELLTSNGTQLRLSRIRGQNPVIAGGGTVGDPIVHCGLEHVLHALVHALDAAHTPPAAPPAGGPDLKYPIWVKPR